MKKTLLMFVVVAAASIAAVGASAPGAIACGAGGYTYAGLAASSHAYGIGATVTPLGAFDVQSGHVAGWVGVGGPGQGPNGSDEWLQVGFSGFPQADGSDLYYELTVPGQNPAYHQIASNLPIGKPVRIAALEMYGRANWWRIWLNGAPASAPIYMPGSHGRWAPIATAEAWDGGNASTCNGFLYRFHRVSIARVPGGGWTTLASGYPITSATTRLRRASAGGSFLAAEGDAALRTLASISP
jgi:hypothetical protein